MRSKLRAKFLPPHYIQDNFTKLHNIRQDGRSVEEYTREFERLLMTCDLRESEDQTIVRYLGGLSESIRNVVELQTFSTLDEVTILAHKVETQRKNKFKREAQKPPQRTFAFPKREPPPTLKPNPIHSVPSNPKPSPPKPPFNPQERRRCYKCQGFGHIASDCPNQRVMTMAECQALEGAEWEEERKEKEVHLMEVEEECIEEADEGELLVLRRALSGHKAPNHEEQRENIFHTRCTIQGRVCSLIVDGGSCANVASTTLVDKLQLKIEPHPQPYSIQWLSTKVRDSKSLQGAWFPSPLAKVMWMMCGVTSFPWMLVMCYLGDLGCMTEGSFMMAIKTPIPSTKMAEKSPLSLCHHIK